MNDIAPEIFLSILWPRFLAMEAGFPWYPTGRPKKYMYEKKIGMAATRPSMMSRVKIGIWRKSRKRAATEAAITAPTAANVVFIQATARYSSGRSLMCARRRLSSRSGSSFLRACTNFPNMRHATCCFGVRLTLTGFAPFGSFTIWCAFSVCSPGLNRFVFVSVPRVSSFSNALLPNRLTSDFDGLRDSGFRQSHLLADPFRGFVGILVVLHDDLRDLSEVGHPFLDHVVDNVDPAGELRLHLFVGHVLHFHDLVEQEQASLVDEGVRGGVPFVHRVRDQFVRLRFESDELDDLLDASHDRVSDPGVRLDDHEVQGREQDPRRVDRRVLQPVDHGLHGVRMHRRHGRVAGRHRLEHRVRLLPADLSHDAVIWPVPQRGAYEGLHGELPAGLAIGPAFAYAGPGRARDPVLVRQVDLTRVLDGDDLRPGADEQCGAVQGGVLSGGGAPADHH